MIICAVETTEPENEYADCDSFKAHLINLLDRTTDSVSCNYAFRISAHRPYSCYHFDT